MMKTMALLAVVALGLAACGSSSKSTTSSSSSGSAKKSASSSSGGAYGSSSGSKTTVASAGSGSPVKIQMEDNFFSQKTISGKPGSTVKVALTNTGQNEHNFKIDGQKAADADVAPGKSATVSVKVPASGSVQFYCEYHKGLGMVGTVKPS
jgi:plastocyanin